jgi:hypothetical protein
MYHQHPALLHALVAERQAIIRQQVSEARVYRRARRDRRPRR